MKDSEFKKAYLEIIKQSAMGETEMNGFQPAENEMTPVTPDETPVEGEGEEVGKVVTFKTADQNLIDALNNGFEEVVFFVKTTDEATGEQTVNEVKFTPESFGEFEVIDDVEQADTVEECGNNTLTEQGEEGGDEGGSEGGDEGGEGDGGSGNEGGEGDAGEGGGEGGDSDIAGESAEEDENEEQAMEQIQPEEQAQTAEEDEEQNDEMNMENDEIDPSEWLEDGVCVKCGKEECDGSCKCPKCGSVNCIGDCE